MRKRMIAVVLILLMLPTFALASRQYIIPDSDTRALTETELWGWDYESLGYILNEIFARHGYNFIPGAKYDRFFSQRPWYTPNADSNNSAACYPQLSNLEWSNEKLVKNVRDQMRAQGTTNPGGKHYLDYVKTDTFDVLSGFTLANLQAGQKLSVYSAPTRDAYRGANGKAMVSTNGTVYVGGWDGSWLLVMYETNKGAVRVGYVEGSSIKGNVDAGHLSFPFQPVNCVRSVALTDDPVTESTSIRTVTVGETLIYLAIYENNRQWVYVETTVDGQQTRGFVPADAVESFDGIDEDENIGNL